MTYELLNDHFDDYAQYNCAEKIVRAANEVYKLGLDQSALRLAAGFGGGMAVGETCGTVTGSVMVLSSLLVKEYAHESDKIRLAEVDFIRRYKRLTESLLCKELKAKYSNGQDRCKKMVLLAAKLLDEVIAEHVKTDLE